jgi:phenylacetate-CoA ligase
LKKVIRYAYNNSPFYNKIFKENNIKPRDIKNLKDFEKIPFTNPEHLQDNPHSFFAVPEEQFVKVFTTAGTTGKPKKAYFTRKDLDYIIKSTAAGLKLMNGITSKDVIRLSVEVGYGTEIWGNRYCLNQAFRLIGALTISTGRLSLEDEVFMLKEYKPTVLMDVTSRISYLTNELSSKYDLKSFGIKKILIGAEPTPLKIRKKIEEAWDAEVMVGYGITEIGILMGGDCSKRNGMHLNELNFFTEVVDEKTGKQINEGAIGELIYTTFNRKGMPLIRYNSHDLGKIIPGLCGCGLPLKRIIIKGRSDNLIPIGSGDNLFPWMFDEIILNIPEVIEYQIVFDRKNGVDILNVTVESLKIEDRIKINIQKGIMNMPEIRTGIENSKTVAKPIVNLVKPNTLNKNSIKFKRLIDNRKMYD